MHSSTGNRKLVWFSLALAAGCFAVVAVLPTGPSELPPRALAILFVAVVLVDAFDLLLPQGDRIALEGPLLAAAALVTAPVTIFGLALAGRLLGLALRREARVPEWIGEVSTTAAGVTAAVLVLLPFKLRDAQSGWVALIAVAAACAALLTTQVVLAQLGSSRRMGRAFRALVRGNLRLQGPLLGAEMSASVLLALSYEQMGPWSLVLVVVLLLLLRHSYGLLISVRRTYMNTIEVLVDTAELADGRRNGHSERTARLAREIGEEMGLPTRDIERLSYAALLHDLDLVSLDPSDADSSAALVRRQTGRILSDVVFLREVVPVLRLIDGDASAAAQSTSEQRTLSMVVALASNVDSYRFGVPVAGAGDVARIAKVVSADEKARVAAAAIRLGYRVPAVP